MNPSPVSTTLIKVLTMAMSDMDILRKEQEKSGAKDIDALWSRIRMLEDVLVTLTLFVVCGETARAHGDEAVIKYLKEAIDNVIKPEGPIQ